MGFFSRNKEALDGPRGDDAPFDATRAPRNTRTPRTPLDGGRESPPPLDPAESAKTRARRRLIGAVVLAAAAVVFVPMLFDRTPVSTADDIALSIPDRDTPFEGRKGLPDPARPPLKASGDLPTVTAGPGPSTPAEPSTPTKVETPAEPDARPSAAPSEPRAEPRAEAKPTPKGSDAAASRPATAKAAAPVEERSKPAASVDDPKALAALEGHNDAASGPAASAAAPSGEHGFAVQVAAYSSSDKAKSMRDSLVANGLRSYTESVSTPQGLRTRVRLGPFPSRDAADRAKQKLKTMKLDGSVVPL